MRYICLQTRHDRIVKAFCKTSRVITPLSLKAICGSTRCISILACKITALSRLCTFTKRCAVDEMLDIGINVALLLQTTRCAPSTSSSTFDYITRFVSWLTYEIACTPVILYMCGDSSEWVNVQYCMNSTYPSCVPITQFAAVAAKLIWAVYPWNAPHPGSQYIASWGSHWPREHVQSPTGEYWS